MLFPEMIYRKGTDSGNVQPDKSEICLLIMAAENREICEFSSFRTTTKPFWC
jgi:hypothetical protein